MDARAPGFEAHWRRVASGVWGLDASGNAWVFGGGSAVSSAYRFEGGVRESLDFRGEALDASGPASLDVPCRSPKVGAVRLGVQHLWVAFTVGSLFSAPNATSAQEAVAAESATLAEEVTADAHDDAPLEEAPVAEAPLEQDVDVDESPAEEALLAPPRAVPPAAAHERVGEPAVSLELPAPPDVQLHLDFASPSPSPVAMRRWAAPFALIPGFGLGHLLGGERRTGLRLMAAGLGGLGAVVVGGGGVILSGASRRTFPVFVSVAILGFSSFLLSTVADLAGAISGGRLRGTAMERERFFLRGGLLYLVDSQFDYGPFLEAEGRARFGAVQLELGGSVAITHDNQRFSAGFRYFLSGAEARGTSSFLRTSLRYHRFGSEGFAHLSGDVAIGGRVELSTFGPSLRGMFVEGEWGLGFQGFGFEATGGGVGNTTNALLVLRAGMGVYLANRGEMSFFYDHRRDGFAGAMSLNSVAAGAIGHIGGEAHGYFGGGEWGLGAEFKYGSAWVTRLMLQRRWW